MKSNYYYIFTIANLLVYFILRHFSVYLSYCQPNFGYKVCFKFCKYIAAQIVVIGLHTKRRRAHSKFRNSKHVIHFLQGWTLGRDVAEASEVGGGGGGVGVGEFA